MPFPGVVVCGVLAGGDTTLTGGLLDAGGLVAVPDDELPPLADPELEPAEPAEPDPTDPEPTDPEPDPFGTDFPGFIGSAGSGRGATSTVCWDRVRPALSRAVKVPKVAGEVNVPPGYGVARADHP